MSSGVKVPVELIGGPKDGLVLVVGSGCRILAVPVRSYDGMGWKKVEYKIRFEGDQPVTNRSGNLLFDYAGEQ